MSVIDHLETEAEEKNPRERRENNEKIQEELRIAYSRVSKEELEVLDDILKQVEEKYPDLNEKVLKRTERFGVMSLRQLLAEVQEEIKSNQDLCYPMTHRQKFINSMRS